MKFLSKLLIFSFKRIFIKHLTHRDDSEFRQTLLNNNTYNNNIFSVAISNGRK